MNQTNHTNWELYSIHHIGGDVVETHVDTYTSKKSAEKAQGDYESANAGVDYYITEE